MIRIDNVPYGVKRWISKHKFYLRLALFAVSVIVIVLSPLLIQMFYFNMPRPSSEFDCDDGTLLMMERLNAIGIKSTPILGSLKKNGESYQESDHIWLLVNIAGLRIAFDWGKPHFDAQHYEGFAVTHQQLLAFVQQDRVSQSDPVSR